MFLCIDLKTFFASVECIERGYDPFKVNLVVANKSRGPGAICLAISPKMKNDGIRNRCRLFEIPKGYEYEIAPPRMKKYIEYAAKVYEVYLKYISKEDIYVYSIDEVFIDITPYLKLYNKTAIEIAKMLIEEVYNTLGLTATAGIGTNMYLAKIALDIISKKVKSNIGYLDEKLFIEKLWNHTPLSDFWQIGHGTEKRLLKYNIKDMEGIAKADPNKLYKEFGVNAELLIDHSRGIEPVTMKEVKNYKRKSKSISNGQILFRDYEYEEAKTIIREMVDVLVLKLVDQDLVPEKIGISIGYSKGTIHSTGGSMSISNPTNSYTELIKDFMYLYNKHANRDTLIRKINISMINVRNSTYRQLEMFKEEKLTKEEKELLKTVNIIKSKYGKNQILRAVSYTDSATGRDRNKLIGGHASGES